MVTGCKGCPLWSKASPLHMRIDSILVLNVIEAIFFMAMHYFSDHFVLGVCSMFVLGMFLVLACWVWGLVVQLICIFSSYPSSDYGLFFH